MPGILAKFGNIWGGLNSATSSETELEAIQDVDELGTSTDDSTIIIFVVVVLALAGIAFALTRKPKNSKA